MGQQLFEPAQSWELGAHATPAHDLSPKGSFAFAENTVLVNNTGGTAVVAQRQGWVVRNTTPQVGESRIIGMYDYVRSTGVLTSQSHHLVVGNNGRLDRLQADNSLVPAAVATPTPFTPGTYPPSFASMKNHCFIANGVDKLKVYDGTLVFDAGMVAPPAPVVTYAGAGNLPVGNYSFLVTYYDLISGLESSASPATAAVTNAAPTAFTVTWVAYAGPHPWTHTRVYMRQDAKQTEHFLAAEVPKPTTSTVINFTQDQLDGLSLIAPDEFENAPPPVGLIGVEAHVSRLFAHNGSRVFYSNLDSPEAWDPDNSFSVNVDDGQKITALHAAHEVLIVFKRDSVWALYGEDPATWTPRMISPSVGCINERSIVYVEGTSYWWAEAGPMKWDGQGPVANIAMGRLDEQVALESGISTQAASPNSTQGFVGIVGVLDIVNQRLIWAIPSVNSSQNNILLPYKYTYDQWESTKWFGMDAASLASVQNSQSTPHVYLGNYKGQVFRYGGAANDGTPSGLLEGQVESATINTLKVVPGFEGELLYTVGAGLTERYLYVNDGTTEGWQVKRIGSNTADTITLAVGETFSMIPNNLWRWSVGTIGFKVILPWSAFASPFIKKRLEYGYFWLGSTVNAAEVEVGLFRNYNVDEIVRQFQLPLEASGLIWNEDNWNEANWGSGMATTRHRRRLSKTCFTYRWYFRQYKPNTDVVIYKVDTRAESQADKP